MIKDLSGAQSNEVEVKELEDLYIGYLEKICPDWSNERVQAEVRDVFKERGLTKSKRRRQEFKSNILRQLEEIRNNPDDWFFRENGS